MQIRPGIAALPLLLAALALAGGAGAAPYLPSDDRAVLEHLPAGALTAGNRRPAATPEAAGLVARGYIERSRRDGDPRFLGCDLSGFPNGRRVTDDVVDIELTAALGALTGSNGLQTCDLSGASPTVKNPGSVVNDGAQPDPSEYLTVFPYLNTPLPGAN